MPHAPFPGRASYNQRNSTLPLHFNNLRVNERYRRLLLGGASDPSYANVGLLLPFGDTDGATSTVDMSAEQSVVTFVGDAVVDDAQSYFGNGSSVRVDSTNGGVDDYLTIPTNAAFQFGSGDFTVEFDVRFAIDPGSSSRTFVSHYGSDVNQRSWTIDVLSGVNLRFGYSTTGANFSQLITPWDPAGDVWYRMAVCRSGTDIYFFVDGTQLGSAQNIGTADLHASTRPLYLGALDGTGGAVQDLNGWLDNVRITKGVARYTASYTLDTEEFPIE